MRPTPYPEFASICDGTDDYEHDSCQMVDLFGKDGITKARILLSNWIEFSPRNIRADESSCGNLQKSPNQVTDLAGAALISLDSAQPMKSIRDFGGWSFHRLWLAWGSQQIATVNITALGGLFANVRFACCYLSFAIGFANPFQVVKLCWSLEHIWVQRILSGNV